MLLTIVTINFNNARGLERTLESLNDQSYIPDVEYIIIDGLSSDNSVKIASEFSDQHSNCLLISEKDSGIYHAMNKGLFASNGKYIAFLNSGDFLGSKNVIKLIYEKLSAEKDVDGLYGDVRMLNLDGETTRIWRGGNFSKLKLFLGWMPPHPMLCLKRHTLVDLGGFDENLKISADYKLMLEAFLRKGVRPIYYEQLLTFMEAGGVSNGSIKNILFANLEVLKAWRSVQGWKIPIWVFVVKPMLKIAQYFRT